MSLSAMHNNNINKKQTRQSSMQSNKLSQSEEEEDNCKTHIVSYNKSAKLTPLYACCANSNVAIDCNYRHHHIHHYYFYTRNNNSNNNNKLSNQNERKSQRSKLKWSNDRHLNYNRHSAFVRHLCLQLSVVTLALLLIGPIQLTAATTVAMHLFNGQQPKEANINSQQLNDGQNEQHELLQTDNQQSTSKHHSLLSKLRHINNAISPKQSFDTYFTPLIERYIYPSSSNDGRQQQELKREEEDEQLKAEQIAKDMRAVIKLIPIAMRAVKDVRSFKKSQNNNSDNKLSTRKTDNGNNGNANQTTTTTTTTTRDNQEGNNHMLIGHRDGSDDGRTSDDLLVARSSSSSSSLNYNNNNNNNYNNLPLGPLLFGGQSMASYSQPMLMPSSSYDYLTIANSADGTHEGVATNPAANTAAAGSGILNQQWHSVYSGGDVVDNAMSSSLLAKNHNVAASMQSLQQQQQQQQLNSLETSENNRDNKPENQSPTSSSISSKSDNGGSTTLTGQSRLMVGKMLSKTDWNALFVKMAKVFLQYFLDLLLNEMFGTTGTSRTFVSTEIDLKKSLKEFLRVASGLPSSSMS